MGTCSTRSDGIPHDTAVRDSSHSSGRTGRSGAENAVQSGEESASSRVVHRARWILHLGSRSGPQNGLFKTYGFRIGINASEEKESEQQRLEKAHC